MAKTKKTAGVKPTGTLKAKQRKAMKPKTFGLPPAKGEPGKYPMPDKSHAANAKARAAQQLKKGNLTKAQHDKIVRKANRVLHGSAANAKAAGATGTTKAKK